MRLHLAISGAKCLARLLRRVMSNGVRSALGGMYLMVVCIYRGLWRAAKGYTGNPCHLSTTSSFLFVSFSIMLRKTKEGGTDGRAASRGQMLLLSFFFLFGTSVYVRE